MPLLRAGAGLVAGCMLIAAAACSIEGLPSRQEFMRLPADVRTGAANSVVGRVESSVDRAEVLEAVQRLVTDASTCFPWPGVWLSAEDRNRRNSYYARYDLMERDWGSETVSTSRTRMNEFVEMGFLEAAERPDIAPGVVEYTLTPEGARFRRGSPYRGTRPQFCPNSQRRVVDITAMEWGQYQCGTLRVRFTHVADNYPTWARTQSARERADTTWGQVGALSEGEVSLSRQWYRPNLLPSGETNGALKSLCLDANQNVTGDDLNLSASSAQTSPSY